MRPALLSLAPGDERRNSAAVHRRLYRQRMSDFFTGGCAPEDVTPTLLEQFPAAGLEGIRLRVKLEDSRANIVVDFDLSGTAAIRPISEVMDRVFRAEHVRRGVPAPRDRGRVRRVRTVPDTPAPGGPVDL